MLVGPMGAGKSTIGRLLASRLDFAFRDVDQLIVDQAGADIPWIFDIEGEEGFRRRETQVLKEELESKRSVIATGGGIVKLSENRALLNQSDCVVYLYADIDTQYERTLKDKNRPMLQGDNPLEKLKVLMKERTPLYEEVATFVQPTHTKNIPEITEDILHYWQSHLA